MPINQAHEQKNAHVKGSGGCVRDPILYRSWMLSELELARLQRQLEEEYIPETDNPRNYLSHHQGCTAQKIFQKQVNSLFIRGWEPFVDYLKLVRLDH